MDSFHRLSGGRQKIRWVFLLDGFFINTVTGQMLGHQSGGTCSIMSFDSIKYPLVVFDDFGFLQRRKAHTPHTIEMHDDAILQPLITDRFSR